MEVAAAGHPPQGPVAEEELARLLHLLVGVRAGALCLAQEQALGAGQEPGLEREWRQQEALELRLGQRPELALGGSQAEHA